MDQKHIDDEHAALEPTRRFGEIRLGDETKITVEVIADDGADVGGGAAPPTPANADSLYPGGTVETGFGDTMHQFKRTVLTLSEAFKDTLSRVSTDECTVEFSIGFKGETKIIPVLLSGSSEGALKVVMKWKK